MSPGGQTIRIQPDLTQEEHIEGLPIGTRGGALVPYTFPMDGDYEIQIRLTPDREEHVEGLNEAHDLEVLVDRERVQVFTVKPPRGSPGASDANVNAPQVDGMTALHWATYQDDVETADLLIRAGANTRAANRYGVTPLSLACTNGNGAFVELLLKAGADPNAPLPGGETPLMTAARVGSLAAVKSLLARGATVDAKDERRGQTALMWAAAEGHADVAQTLIELGGDPRLRLGSGFTPLLFAVREGQSAVVRVLLKAGADVNEPVPMDRKRGYGGRLPPAGASPLLLAVMNATSSWPRSCSTPGPIPMPT